MKNPYLISHDSHDSIGKIKALYLLGRKCMTVFVFFILLSLCEKLWIGCCFSQTAFLNSGAHISVTPNCTTYVNGNLINNSQGFIHNNGNIYITGDWTNNEPSGCLDPAAGTVTLYGGNQLIQGSQPTTFNNLDCLGNGTKTLLVNTIAGGNSGALSLNANPLNLNSKTLIITNALPSAITRTTGYIISETDASTGYGTIQWNIVNAGAGNNFIFPFGTTNGDYIPFHFNVTSAGAASGTGNISTATYPTNTNSSPNNRPLPSGITNLTDVSTGKDVSEKCADRFWLTGANNYTSNPTADIIFTYRDIEWDATGGSTNTISEDSLRAWRWNGSQWQIPPIGVNNAFANTVVVTGVNTFSAWTLFARDEIICGPLYVPNAFSPNDDGENDVFRPLNNCFKNIHLVIFDRWGEKVFEYSGPEMNSGQGWNGTYKGKEQNTGVFVYVLDYELTSGDKGRIKGNVSLLK